LQQNLRRHNENLQQLVQDQVKEIADAQLSTIIAIVKLAEARDDDTGQHIERTRTFCKMTAEYLLENDIYVDEIDSSFIESIHTACPLHDIGKIAIPDSILLKPAKLTPEEFEIMKTHTTQGAQNLRMVQKKYPHNEFINMGICIAQSHHEKWNGSGYPHGLKGQDIPLAARIMALADVYDALRSKRVYKDAFSHEKSKEIITAGKGTHFDPNIIDTFLALESEFNRIRQEMDQ
jgi:putative two-component system response regulator